MDSRSVRRVLLVSMAVMSVGCAAQKRSTPVPPTVVATTAVDQEAEAATTSSATTSPPATGQLVSSDDPDVQAAMKEFETSGKAPIIKREDFVRFPFGQSEPVLTCKPLHACDVELQEGEELLGIGLGDAERWEVDFTVSGNPDEPTPHLIAKAKFFDIATNLIVTTSRRTYHIKLVYEGSIPTDPFRRAGRLQEIQQLGFLRGLGLAERVGTLTWQLSREVEPALRQYQLTRDIIKSRAQAGGDHHRYTVLQEPTSVRVHARWQPRRRPMREQEAQEQSMPYLSTFGDSYTPLQIVEAADGGRYRGRFVSYARDDQGQRYAVLDTGRELTALRTAQTDLVPGDTLRARVREIDDENRRRHMLAWCLDETERTRGHER